MPKPAAAASRPTGVRSLQIAIMALGVYMLLTNLSGIYLLRYTASVQERNLNEFLEQVSDALTRPRGSFQILEFLYDPGTGEIDETTLQWYRENSPDWRSLQESLAAVARDPRIAAADLLTPFGEIVLRGEGTLPPPGERGFYLQRDPVAIDRAAAGEAGSPILSARDLNKRRYVPISNSAGTVVGILRLEIDPTHLEPLRVSRNRFLIGFVVSTFVVIFIWLLTMRLVRRTIDAERAVGQADRLRALGTLTAGMAHEIRNPLGIIALQIEEMKAFLKDVEDQKLKAAFAEVANNLHDETQRLKVLTQSFLTFSKASSATESKSAAMSIEPSVGHLVGLWGKGLIPEKRRFVYTNEAGAARIVFSEDKLRQVLLNLLRNADEALGTQEGEIRLRVTRDQTWVRLAVSDTGPGIETGVVSQIFDPFFTTRAEGTGLGLSLSRALVESAGGRLTVQSRPGEGATFTVELRAA